MRPAGADQESLFEAIVGTVRQPLLALDRNMTVRLANSAFHQFFGPSADRVEGRNLFDVGDGLWDIPELRRLLEQVAENATLFENYSLEAMRTGVGARSLVLNVRLLDVDGETLILLALEDVTARDGLEQLVAERTAELQAFNYSVSHDLRAPLRALDGFSRALAEDCSPQLGAEGLRYLGLIRANAAQMGALIDGLLTFSRLGRQGLHRRDVDVRSLVDGALVELAPELAGRTVDVALGELPSCNADPLLLRQVFANLIGNALKFTRDRPEPRIEIGSHVVDGERVWSVSDNGVGFDMAYAGRLFETFQRLHRSDEYEGTGIGLALVHLIVQRHGGQITADAVAGSGATFSFTLPSGAA